MSRSVRALLVAAGLMLALGSCSVTLSDESDESVTSQPATTTLPAATTSTSPEATASSPTTTQPATTTTTTVPAFEESSKYLSAAVAYCNAWPAVEGLLAPDVSFVVVGPDSVTVPERAGFRKGVSPDVSIGTAETLAAIDNANFSDVECSGKMVVSGDWVAVPFTATRDNNRESGIWILRIITTSVHWHLIYTDPAASSSGPDQQLAHQAREFCAIIEGTGYTRDADEFLAAMTDDPAVHNLPEGLYWTRIDSVRSMVEYYPRSDNILCGDDITTNGPWSAEPITIDNNSANLTVVGMMIHYHTQDAIHRQFAHFTRTRGEFWGLPLPTD